MRKITNKLLLIILTLGIFLLAGCAQMEDRATNSTSTQTAEIAGLVKGLVNNQNVALADVLVQVDGRSESTYTNSDGEFTIYLRPRSAGGSVVWTEDIGLLFNKEGFTKYNDSAGTALSTPYQLTIERGRTTVVRVGIKP